MSRRYFDLAIPGHQRTSAAADVRHVIAPTSGKPEIGVAGSEIMTTDPGLWFRAFGFSRARV
jgi:hypothetical protein